MTSNQTSRITSIVRRPDGLYAILSTRKFPFTPPSPPKEDEADGLAGINGGPYAEEIVPLERVPESIFTEKKLLTDAWKNLEQVGCLNQGVLANVLYILTETVTDSLTDPIELPPLVLEEPPPSPKATAAHPRAYKGTKYKPPKPTQPEPLNLHGYLCSLPDMGRLLAKLNPFFDEWKMQVVATPCSQQSLTSDVRPLCYEQWRSPEYLKRLVSLPAAFHRDLLWSLRGNDWETVSAALSIYWALGLDDNESLRLTVSYFLTTQPVRQALDWCRVACQMPPARRIYFLELLMESEAHAKAPTDKITADLLRADAFSNDSVYRHRMFYALRTVKEGHSLSYAIDGFLLANQWNERYTFVEVSSLEGVERAVSPIAQHVFNCGLWHENVPLTLWNRCSQLDGYNQLLENLDWRSLDPDSAYRLLTILGDIVYEELPEKKLRRKWDVIRRRAESLLQVVAKVEVRYRPKALEGLSSILWYEEDEKKLDRVLALFCPLLIRLCAPPFKERDLVAFPLTALTALPPDEWTIIEKAEDAAFIKLESATARKNEAALIGRGLWALSEIVPQLCAQGFARYPQQLFKTAQTLGALGVLGAPIRREIITNFTRHPLISTDPLALNIDELLTLVETHLRLGIADPIPKRLREHVRGVKTLQPAQVKRDLAMICDKWLALQLDVLNQAALDQMSLGLPLTERTSKVQHALMLQQLAEEHRRSLRQLLKAHLSGHQGYRENHPKSREWLSKHPKVDETKWCEGISLRSEVPGHGEIILSIESDPLEVLRLGTYFGTCLGIGGILTYSAAAITLDINKQVIYARTATGRVIARQLVAIAEDDTLICFSVYPASSPKDICLLFRDYDLQLAAYLGIEVQKGESDDEWNYEVASIVSSGFWDDGAWDLNMDKEE